MSRKRVVITGIGLTTSLADSSAALVDALLTMRSGIVPLTRFDPSTFPTRFGGQHIHFNLAAWGIDPRESKRLDRFAQFGLAAAIGAVRDSGLDFAKEDLDRAGVMIGSGVGGLETIQEQHKIFLERGVGRVSPFTVPKLMTNAAAANVSIRFNLRGPNSAVSTACSTGANAIGDAARAIQSDLADTMLAGASEAALCELGLASFCAARALSTRNDDPTRASRPWDKDRDGFVLSEGAAVLTLESYDHATARNARIYAELVGYGQTADAFHITSPETNGTGAAAAMRAALKDAALNPQDIPYVNAHGTSTDQGDLAETKAIQSVFASHAANLMVSSTKGQTGHLCAAAGALSLAVSALALHRNLIPATANHDAPGDGCTLDYVPNHPREKRVPYVMSNSFGFGGHNTSLILKRI